jgi:hypothetical protein
MNHSAKHPPHDLAGTYRLFAAAHDLLAVCEELVESAYYWGDYDVPIGLVDRIREAVAKAKVLEYNA